MKRLTLLFLTCACLVACESESPSTKSSEAQHAIWLDSNLALDVRVDALVAEMTLAEKISQMYNDAPAIARLNIPAYNWWNEALHGVARAGKATVFPQAIGMAAMFDENSMHDIASVIADEARAKHHDYFENDVVFKYTGLTFWSPNINIFRDPRWGRGQETYGEDPYLTGQLALQFIKGLQGDDDKYLKTAAMAKHFAVHSGPEKSRHSDNYYASPRDLYETYLPAFQQAVEEGKVESIMCAYNRVNDEPACGNDFLLKETLREKWKFDGHVVSDCGAISDFYDRSAHDLVRAPSAAAAWAVRSGTDLNCGTGHLSVFANLHFAVQRNMISEAEITQAVSRLFRTRFKLGLFDAKESVPYANIPMSVVGSEKHLTLAEKAARQSLVLLKNNGVLPLKQDVKVAVIGPNATNPDVLVGNYNGTPIKPISVLQGIQDHLGEGNVSYSPGASLAGEVYGHYEAIAPEYFFHRDESGALRAGLQANYYNAVLPAPSPRERRNTGEIQGEPVMTRVDANIDFYWQRSPLDNSVWDEFAVVWEGILKPSETGIYQFQTSATISLDEEKIDAAVELQAGKEYAFKAERIFVRSEWGNPLEANVSVAWVNTTKNVVAEAVTLADKADVVIYVGGISPRLEGEEMRVELDGFDYGDRTHIDLPQEQQDLLEVLHALGKPVVMLNFSGSAIALNWQAENLDAIVQAFYPGEATGKAVADLLWGQFSPSGRLPVTFYSGVDDLPSFKDYDMAGRTYKYYEGEPLYPFGHGLSYTTFSYGDLIIDQADAGIQVRASVENTGTMTGREVSQVYVSLLEAPDYVPLRKLVAFASNELAPKEEAQLTFALGESALSYIDDNGQTQDYSGRIQVTVGAGQAPYLDGSSVVAAEFIRQR